jgi:mannose-6-phosphate isomerase-like protein (cupin superfamily)
MTTEPRKGKPGVEAQYARRMNQESSVLYMDCLFSVLAGSGETGGCSGLMQMVALKGREPSRHLHHTDDEGFYMLEGSVTFHVGEETYGAGPGTFVFLPHGSPLLHLRDRRGAHALHHRAGRIGGTLPRSSIQRASQGHDAAPLAQAPGPDVLKAMAEDLVSYGTGVVGPPVPLR